MDHRMVLDPECQAARTDRLSRRDAMTVWKIWSAVGFGAFEYLGEAEGETFQAASRRLAAENPNFREAFDPHRMTFQGCPLVPLDRRIDGTSIQFGNVRDGLAE